MNTYSSHSQPPYSQPPHGRSGPISYAAPSVPRAAKKKRPGKALTWLKRLLWSFNLVLLCTLCLGAYQYFDAREKTDNARLALSKAVERQKELQAERDGAAAYVNAMQNENSSLLLNEARERLNMAQPDEVIINLKEKI